MSLSFPFLMSGVKLSFTDWVYATKHPRRHICAWSNCGLFAHAVSDVLTIFGGDNGALTPMISWRPFEHNITALAWYDGSMCPERNVPVIVIASKSGRLSVYDLCAKKNIAYFKIGRDYATTIQWSPFSTSTFFVGTCGGDLICCDVFLGQLVKSTQKWTLKVGFPIDFISIEPNYGDSLTVASSVGNIAFIDKLNSGKPEISGDPMTLSCAAKSAICQMEYFRSYSDFLMIVTKVGTVLHSVQEQISVSLFAEQNLVSLYQLSSSGNLMIGVKKDSVHLYEFVREPAKLQDLYLGSQNVSLKSIHVQREIIASCFANDKLLLLTSGWVLITIEVKRRKMFVTGYMKLLGAKPLDWSFWRGSLAISTTDGQLLVTRVTQLTRLFAPTKPKKKKLGGAFETAREPAPAEPTAEARSPLSRRITRRMSKSMRIAPFIDPRGIFARVASVDGISKQGSIPDVGEMIDPIPDDAEISTQSIVSRPKLAATPPRPAVPMQKIDPRVLPILHLDQLTKSTGQVWKQRRNSVTEERVDYEIIDSVQNVISKGKVREAPTNVTLPQPQKNVTEYGNSRSFLWAFDIAPCPLQHVEWICQSKILVWGTETLADECIRNYAYLVDCRNKRLISLINRQIDALNLPLTSVVVSDNRRCACLVLNGKIATVMTLLPDIKTIGSFPFGSRIVCAFSPSNDRLAFLDHNGRMRITTVINPKNPAPVRIETSKKFDMKKDPPTFLLWKTNKKSTSSFLVGVTSGSLLKIKGTTWTITTISALKNPISKIIRCGKGIVVVDNRGNTTTIGFTVDFAFPDVVKNIKSIARTTFVVRGSGEGRIKVIQNTGKFVPFYAPSSSRCHVMKTQEGWAESVRALEPSNLQQAMEYASHFGMSLIRFVLESMRFPDARCEQLTVLRNTVQRHPKFKELAMRLSLVIGDRQRAHDLCLSGLSEQKLETVIGILKSTMFLSPKAEGIRDATKQLITIGEYDHALDLWMIGGKWKSVVKCLLAQRNYRQCLVILAARCRSEKDKGLIGVAMKYFRKSPNNGIEFRLLGQSKNVGEVASLYENINEVEQAQFVRMCSIFG